MTSTRIEKRAPGLRKAPRQARSKATVEALIEAGARILAEEGWTGFTTNKVAERAGASIGSLYQYFPDKLSLIEGIRRRHLDDCLDVLRRSACGERSPLRFAENLIDALIEIHSFHPKLHRVLLDEAPSFETFRDPHSAFEAAYLGFYAEAVAALDIGDRAAEIETVALILSDAIDGVIHNAARRGALQSPQVRCELVRLVTAYLASAGDEAPRG